MEAKGNVIPWSLEHGILYRESIINNHPLHGTGSKIILIPVFSEIVHVACDVATAVFVIDLLRSYTIYTSSL